MLFINDLFVMMLRLSCGCWRLEEVVYRGWKGQNISHSSHLEEGCGASGPRFMNSYFPQVIYLLNRSAISFHSVTPPPLPSGLNHPASSTLRPQSPRLHTTPPSVAPPPLPYAIGHAFSPTNQHAPDRRLARSWAD